MDISQFKNEFIGKKYQWLITPDPSIRTGRIVSCIDVVPSGNSAVAKFNDGTFLNIDVIDDYMGDGNQPTLEVPNEAADNQDSSPQSPPTNESSSNTQPKQESSTPHKVDLFENFSKSNKNIDFKVSIDLPDFNLIKLMYQNASDKEDFLNQLAKYTIQNVDENVIKQSWNEILESDQEAQTVLYNDDDEK
jgi:hypothetical protein